MNRDHSVFEIASKYCILVSFVGYNGYSISSKGFLPTVVNIMVIWVKSWRRKWQPTPVFLPGESHGQRSLVGCSPWGLTESDTTEATWQAAELNPSITVHFSSLIPKMLTFSCHLLSDHFKFALIHGPKIPGSYAILLFTAFDFASITSHIHSWVLFLLWFHLFILSWS